jgi:DNA polymerase III subunit delta'
MLRKWEHPDLHFTFPTIKTSEMSGDHTPVSLDFMKEWREMLLQEGPYVLISDWMQRMGKTDADFNKQAIITADETDNLSRELSMMSSQGGYKISLIWLPERMNLTSANKILKLLEEPPHQTLFLLVSEQPELLLETIRSRAQRIDLKKIETSEVEKALIERRALDAESAHRIARIANGNWNHALEELDSGNENRQHLDMFIMLMRLSYMRNIHDLKKWSEVVATFGREKQKRMLDYFMHMLRESFMYNFRQPELSYMTQEEENFARNFARFINEANIIDISNLFDGTPIKHPGDKFCCGVACYPEKHEEAPNLEMDMKHLLEKQQLGADYAITQLFYDNEKFYAFVEKARQMGITIPIVPALKPFAKLSQLTMVPKTFHCDIPEALAQEVLKCKSDEDAKALGIEWTTAQVKDLFDNGYNHIHFFTVSAVDSVKQIAKILF